MGHVNLLSVGHAYRQWVIPIVTGHCLLSVGHTYRQCRANTRLYLNAGLMLVHLLRCWPTVNQHCVNMSCFQGMNNADIVNTLICVFLVNVMVKHNKDDMRRLTAVFNGFLFEEWRLTQK